MNLHDFLKIYPSILQNNHIPLLVGPPGCGKTQGPSELAASLGYEVIFSHPVVAEPTDYKGFPALERDSKTASFYPYGDLAHLTKTEVPTLFMIDDLGQQSSILVQGAIMQMIEQRTINGIPISPHVRFIAASNRPKDKAGVAGIIQPLLNRFDLIIEIEQSLSSWQEYILGKNYKYAGFMVGFIQQNPNYLLHWNPSSGLEGTTTARSLEKLLKIWDADYISDESISQELAISCVGGECGIKWVGFLKLINRFPKFSDILTDPVNHPVPPSNNREDLQVLFAMASSLPSHCDEPEKAESILTYLDRFPPELCILGIRIASRMHNKIVVNTTAYRKHCLTHATYYGASVGG